MKNEININSINWYVGPPVQPTLMTGSNDGVSIHIVWTGADDITCGSVTYHVKLSATSDGRLIKQDTTQYQIYAFTGLTPDTNYTASVYGRNQAGDGPTASLNVKTVSNNNNGNHMHVASYCISWLGKPPRQVRPWPDYNILTLLIHTS